MSKTIASVAAVSCLFLGCQPEQGILGAEQGIPGAEEPGGQSGTDASDDPNPGECPDPVPLDEALRWDDILVSRLVATTARKHPPIYGAFRQGEEHTSSVELELELDQVGAAMHVYGPLQGGAILGEVCDYVQIPVNVSLNIRSRGGEGVALSLTALDQRAYLIKNPSYAVVGGDPLGRVPDVLGEASLGVRFGRDDSSGPEQLPEGTMVSALVGFTYSTTPVAIHDVTLRTVHFTSSELSADGQYVEQGGGEFNDYLPPSRQAPPECEHGESSLGDRTTFGSAAEAFAAAVGRWAYCSDEAVPFAGFEIFEDGTWQSILNGEPQLGIGFGRQGVATIEEYTDAPPRPGTFGLNLQYPEHPSGLWGLPGPAIVISESGSVLGGSDSGQFVRFERPVAAAALPLFDLGERGSSAACASMETHLDPFASSESELQANLAGRWVACSGYAGTVHFDGVGTVTFPGSESYPAHTEAYEVINTLGASAELRVGTEHWRIVRSAQPVKLWIAREGRFEYPSLDTIVLSAEP